MSATGRSDKLRPSRGFALILVAWFLVLIAAIGTYLMVNARAETAIARNIRSAATAEALADSGIALAVFSLIDPVESNQWKLDDIPHRLKLAGGEVSIRVSDENAKINPNHASDVLLAALFKAVGVDRSPARRLGAAIADWVGPDMPKRPLGAKLTEYQAAGRSYGPPNAPAESLDELQLVLGMTPEIFAAVRPYLTIYSDGEEPDAKNASPVVQAALLLAAREPPLDGGKKVAAEAPDEPPGPDDVEQNKGAQAETADPAAAEKPAETVVDVEVTARGNLGGVFVRHAVLKLQPDNPKGYSVLEWRRADFVEGTGPND